MDKLTKAIKFLAKKILEIPAVKKWLVKHPKISYELRERLSTRQFSGLPMTILFTVFFISIYYFLGVTEDYLNHDPLVLLDARIANLLYVIRSTSLLHFFYFVTLFAEPVVIIALTLLISILFLINKQKVYIFTLGFALVFGEGLAFLGKIIFQRERPDIFLRAITEDSFSFPSGHAVTAVLFYGFIAYLVLRNYKTIKIRIATIFSLILIVCLIDLSRLYLGVHYLSDVLAGNLLGFAILILSIGITEWIITRRNEFIPNKIKIYQILTILFLTFVVVSTLYYFANPPVSKNRPVTINNINIEDVLPLFDNKKLPRFTETIIGATQEPINLIIISPESCFVKNIESSNWDLAEGISLSSTERLAKTALYNQVYPTAPITPSFYNAEPNDYGFEKQTDRNSVRARHHARFWKTDYVTPLGSVFVGTVSLDTGLKWGITHTIAPDIDTERDVFVSDMTNKGIVSEGNIVNFVPPILGSNFAGDQFFTNGRVALLTFSACK